MKESITALEWRESDPPALRCACCGGLPSLWEVDREGTITKMVNCDRAELRTDCPEAPITESCPMYSPSLAFNKATRREAVNYWNMFQARLAELYSSQRCHGLKFDAFGKPRTRYVRVTLDGSHCVMHPSEGDRYVQDARAAGDAAADRYEVRDVYLSEREFDDLPEFNGF